MRTFGPFIFNRSTRIGLMVFLAAGLTGCANIIQLSENLPGNHQTVRVIRHRGYYKDHLYAKHPHIGKLALPWLEKPQGTRNAGLKKVRRH